MAKVGTLRNRRRPFSERKWSSWKFRATYLCERDQITKVGCFSWNQLHNPGLKNTVFHGCMCNLENRGLKHTA
jgi:hypothetical protein